MNLRHLSKIASVVLCVAALGNTPALAQFSGPSPTAKTATVAQAKNAQVNSYVTVTGNLINHLRGDYYTFRDASGEMRVEIESTVFNNRKVDPDTKVRLQAEVDRSAAGIYLWVKTLDIVN